MSPKQHAAVGPIIHAESAIGVTPAVLFTDLRKNSNKSLADMTGWSHNSGSKSSREQITNEIRDAARAEGYAAGWAQGRRDAAAAAKAEATRTEALVKATEVVRQTEFQRALTGVKRAAKILEQKSVPIMEDIADTITTVCFELTEILVGRELALSREPGQDAVRRTLAYIPSGNTVKLHLHPNDYESVGKSGLTTSSIHDVSLEIDPSVKPGDGVAVCESILVEARIADAMQRLRQVLLP